jgi:hypothetical protein
MDPEKIIDAGEIDYTGFVHGPQKLNYGSQKIIYSGTIDQNVTVLTKGVSKFQYIL